MPRAGFEPMIRVLSGPRPRKQRVDAVVCDVKT